MDCILCRENGYVLVKGYQVDRQFKVSCPFCAKEKFEGEKIGAPDKKLGMTCTRVSKATFFLAHFFGLLFYQLLSSLSMLT